MFAFLTEMEPDLIINSHQADAEYEDFGNNLIRLKVTDQVKELQTVLRDRLVSKIRRKKCQFRHERQQSMSSSVTLRISM